MSDDVRLLIVGDGPVTAALRPMVDPLGWTPTVTFEQGMAQTVDWYLANQPWVQRVLDGSYRLERIGQS